MTDTTKPKDPKQIEDSLVSFVAYAELAHAVPPERATIEMMAARQGLTAFSPGDILSQGHRLATDMRGSGAEDAAKRGDVTIALAQLEARIVKNREAARVAAARRSSPAHAQFIRLDGLAPTERPRRSYAAPILLGLLVCLFIAGLALSFFFPVAGAGWAIGSAVMTLACVVDRRFKPMDKPSAKRA